VFAFTDYRLSDARCLFSFGHILTRSVLPHCDPAPLMGFVSMKGAPMPRRWFTKVLFTLFYVGCLASSAGDFYCGRRLVTADDAYVARPEVRPSKEACPSAHSNGPNLPLQMVRVCALRRRIDSPGERPCRRTVVPAENSWRGLGGDEW
jgi:hypothetical protein